MVEKKTLGKGTEQVIRKTIKADDLCEKWGFGRAYKSYNPPTKGW